MDKHYTKTFQNVWEVILKAFKEKNKKHYALT